MFYGSNEFLFDTAREANHWAIAIGKQMRHVRKVWLDVLGDGGNRRAVKKQAAQFESFLRLLRQAQSLESINLGLNEFTSEPYTPRRIAKLFQFLLREIRQHRHENGDRSDVVRIVHADCEGPFDTKPFVGTIKKELRLLLGGAEAEVGRARHQKFGPKVGSEDYDSD